MGEGVPACLVNAKKPGSLCLLVEDSHEVQHPGCRTYRGSRLRLWKR